MTDDEFWKAMKLCSMCHRRKPTNGKCCDECQKKSRDAYWKKIEIAKKQKDEERKRICKTCYICGQRIDGYKGMCDRCRSKVVIPECIRNGGK